MSDQQEISQVVPEALERSQGRWVTLEARFNHLPVHMALLPSGKVLAFGGSANSARSLEKPWPAEIFDPVSRTVEVLDQAVAGDMFCAGHAFLPDGRLLSAGGTAAYDRQYHLPVVDMKVPVPPFSGHNQAYIFETESRSWTRIHDMRRPRWYPTLVTLGDGRILCVAGLTNLREGYLFLNEVEIYEPGTGWSKLEGADRFLPLYPRMHLLPDGKVFYAGSYNTHYTFPFSLKSFPTGVLDPATGQWTSSGLPKSSEREEGTSVLLPLLPPDYQPRVLLVGGGEHNKPHAVNKAEIMDFAKKSEWETVSSMSHERYYCYPVLLPDKRVLITGGRRGEKTACCSPIDADHDGHHDDPLNIPQDREAIREAEIYDPDAGPVGAWSSAGSMSFDRLYHSNALLLPDGTVMVAGSNPGHELYERSIEIYQPSYFFRGDRPLVSHAPSAVHCGQAFDVETPDAESLTEVALIRISVTTHCLNTDQRYVGLEFQVKNSGSITVSIPNNANLVPPGHYMLFLIRAGVPSVAPILQVAACRDKTDGRSRQPGEEHSGHGVSGHG